MIELIHKRHSEKDGHAMDVLMEALRKQRVQAHIARELHRALARAKDQKKGARARCHLFLEISSQVDNNGQLVWQCTYLTFILCLQTRLCLARML